MIVCTILGIVIERLAYKPLRAAPILAVLITAIGVSYFLQNAALLLWSSNPKVFPPVVANGNLSLFDGQLTIPYVTLVTILACVVIMIALVWFTGKTKMGKAMRACSEDKGAAQLMGINVNGTISLTFAIGSGLAAIAGVLLCSAYPTLVPTTGAMPGIKAFTAAVFGGIGSIPGAMVGGILLGIIEIFAKAYISTQLSDAIVFAVLIIVLIVKPAERKFEVAAVKRTLRLNKTTRNNYVTYAVVILAFLVMQILSSTGGLSSTMEGMLVPICAYVVMAVSLNLTVGVLGELSLGHAGFMSVGAFTGVTAAVALGNHVSSGPVRLIVGMIVGALFAALVGFLIGIPVLRLKGDYLAIVTLAFGEIIKGIFNNLFVGIDSSGLHVSLLSDKTNLAEDGQLVIGGPMGLQSIPRLSNFVIGVILVLITLIIVFHLVNSRSGRAIMAVRDNRIAAESVGINVTKYKLMAFTVSAALAGAAGTLFAMNYTTIVANKFDFNTSILILVFVVLGGLGNMLGSIIAATALTILPEALREFSDYRMLVYAIVLILVMLATNNDTFKSFLRRLKPGQKKKKEVV